jgi:hypothetical protein
VNTSVSDENAAYFFGVKVIRMKKFRTGGGEENEPASGQEEGCDVNVRITVKMEAPRQYGITIQTTSL